MLLGNIDEITRSRPTYTGQRAICPFCEGELIAKCGDIYINHWQHKPSPNCDSWKENEGEWHYTWKSHFPLKNQEIIITKGIEKHIADIQTDHGLVIEFQNSPISQETILIREAFYGNMIWVINAKLFVQNLKLKSIVNHQLKFNQNAFEHELYDNEAFYDEIIRDRTNDLNEWERKKSLLGFKLADTNADFSSCKEAIIQIDEFCSEVVAKLFTSTLFERFSLHKVSKAIGEDIKAQYKQCLDDVQSLTDRIQDAKIWVERFSTFESLFSEQIEYKIIPTDIKIDSSNYLSVLAVHLHDKTSMFPVIISFKSKTEFERVKDNSNYCILINKSEFEDNYGNKISNLETQLKDLFAHKNGITETLKTSIHEQLQFVTKKSEKEVSEITKELDECDVVISNLIDRITESKANKQREHEEISRSIIIKQKASDFEIMKKYKGLYLFTWKNQRKSWQVAKRPIFLDTGEDFLFEIIAEDCLRKVDKATFLKQHSGSLHF